MITQSKTSTAMKTDPVRQVSERLVMGALSLLNRDAIEKPILQLVKSSPDPAQGLAQATVLLVKILSDKMKGTPPQQAVLPAVGQILGVVARMCQSAGVLKASPQLMDKAIQVFLQKMQGEAA